jgi:hypothetical protein
MSNVTKIRKNKKRPAGAKNWTEFKKSKERFEHATQTNRPTGLAGLDLMTNVEYYQEHGTLPEHCGVGLKRAE